jgi:sugar phosphate isomerase/epimerase
MIMNNIARFLSIVILLAGFINLNSYAQGARYKISLAEWSIHRLIESGKVTNLDFPGIAKRNYGLDAVEYVSTFFNGKAEDTGYLAALKDSCSKYGVKSLLIMVDGEGDLADSSLSTRSKAVENHYKWVKAARFLGCHSIRVNAGGRGLMGQMQLGAIDALGRLADYASKYGVNVIVEDHGGNSSIGIWLSEIIRTANRPNLGTLPDFNNFEAYDPYKGIADLMPFARGVSGQTREFDKEGNDSRIDFKRMMKIVSESEYKGYIDVEYSGTSLSVDDGIKANLALLKRVIEPYNR